MIALVVRWTRDATSSQTTAGTLAALVDRYDPGVLDPESVARGRVWGWMLADTANADRGILSGDDGRGMTRDEAERQAATAIAAEHDA